MTDYQSTPDTAARPGRGRTGTVDDASHAPQPDGRDLMGPVENLTRIMWTGTLWFAAAVVAVALALGAVLVSGWRPDVLSTPVETLFWIGASVVALSLGLIGWSGCPILEVSVPVADRNKTRTMQLGTFSFLVGSAATMLAVLLGPAG
ncbi:hypothetical protein [Frigoribacterium sp. VKM Ac-2530]|uniref:hypothetical protein n=1 Tax=Frigoribacterium sp. VKM Ac-2530 TaxID=2783822 RepID=UPI00188D8B8B|nr:hypothetical protein [Frigoribacterium sp. VKM Ac-2530]MBF4579229.1 hypothetical protein [Frigoribacterium sp. VKM Ac-2530]